MHYLAFGLLAVFLNSNSATLMAAPVYKKQKEHWYQEVWCQGKGGKVEYKLKDGRRVDCLTDTHAIEMEFARNWPEAIGQSLDYSMLTTKQAGIVLILQSDKDETHWQRMNQLINHYQLPITVWKLGP
ncbi:hypothetical protein [Candidatus Sororendozoicomonas aggregata]|uniref:hypothetical protein n=1 Tax=Candidatus Sororendozoicomonas aggregata TaxID=3073239 RepID=UPI002ED20F28